MLQLAADSSSTPSNSTDPDWFGSFWILFPRKEAKKDAMRAWRHIPPVDYPEILESLVQWRNVWRQQQRATHHIALPATWLRGERWTDEIPIELQTVQSRGPVVAADPKTRVLPSGGDPEHSPRVRQEIPPSVQKVLDQLMGRNK